MWRNASRPHGSGYFRNRVCFCMNRPFDQRIHQVSCGTQNLVNPLIEIAFFREPLSSPEWCKAPSTGISVKMFAVSKILGFAWTRPKSKLYWIAQVMDNQTWVWIFFNYECSVILFKNFVTTKEESTSLQVNVRVQLLQVIQSTSTLLLMSRPEE